MQDAVAVQVADLAAPEREGELAALAVAGRRRPATTVTSSVICSLAVCVVRHRCLLGGSDGRPRTLEVQVNLKSRPRCGLLPACDELLTIGEVARRSGVASSALRFYEERGLIGSERAGSGHRRYPRPVLRRIAFIVFAQRVGLTLDEIGARAREAAARPRADAARLVAPVERLDARGSTSASPSSSASRPG